MKKQIALALTLAFVLLAGSALAFSFAGECSGQAEVMVVSDVTRTGHFSHPVYTSIGTMDVATCPSLISCCPCDEGTRQDLRAKARESFGLDDRPFVIRFR